MAVTLTTGKKVADLDSNEVRRLQEVLIQAGFDPGPVDGILGQKTKDAYARFLGRNALDPRGAQQILSLMSQLSSGEVPELWGGVVNGGEIVANKASIPNPSTSLPAAAPAPAAPAAPATPDPAAGVSAVQQDNYVPPPDAATEESVRARYPHLAYLLDDPDVKSVLMLATQKGWTEAELQGALFPTAWWQKHSDAMRVWDQKFYQDPATAQREWDAKTLAVMNKAMAAGVPMDQTGAQWVAGRILREGWDDNQLNRFMGQLVRQAGGAGFGSIRETQAQLQQTAGSFLTRLTDTDATEYATRIMEGSASKDTVVSMLREQAKARFHWLAPQLDAGMTAVDLFRGTRQAVAEQLEIDPETIDLNNPKWSAITSPMVEGNTTRSMNYYEAQQWARRQADWQFTNNANRSVSDKGLKLLTNLGILKG